MSLLPGYKANFETMLQAAKNGDLALMDCTDKITGKQVATVVAVQRETDGSFLFVPVAKLFDGNPYEEIDPPNLNGEVQ